MKGGSWRMGMSEREVCRSGRDSHPRLQLVFAPYEAEGLGAAALELGDGPALAAAEGATLAAGDTVGLAEIAGLGDAAVTSVVPAVGVDCLLRLRAMGTTTIPSAVTIRKLTAPHSRRKNSRFKLRPTSSPAQSTSVVV